MSRSLYKPLFLDINLYLLKFFFFKNNAYNSSDLKKKNNFINSSLINLKNRNSIILEEFLNLKFKVYNGKIYKNLIVNYNMLGHKFGEFFMTRKRAIFKPKQKKK